MIDANLLERATNRIKAKPDACSDTPGTLHSTLSALVESLETANRSVDARFLNVGERLQRAFANARQLASEMAETIGLSGSDSEDSGLDDIRALVECSRAALQSDHDRTFRRLQQVELMAVRLADLRPWSATLSKIARRLRVISIYFAVEGSRSSDLSATFQAFTAELRQLADHVLQIASNIAHDSSASEAKQNAARSLIEEENRHLKTLSENAEQTFAEAASDIARVVELSVAALNCIAAHSERISQCVSTAVVSIQFHDITRQQTEHIIAALHDALLLLERHLNTPEDEPSRNSAFGSAYSALRVQSAQLHSVISSVEKAHTDIEQAFRDIADQSRKISATAAELASDGNDGASCRDPLSDLNSALRELCQLLEMKQALDRRTQEAAGDASEASSVLSQYVSHLDDLNSELDLKALNATIKSAGLRGRGQAMAVLAKEVASLSQACNGFVENMAAAIESVSAVATDLSSECDNQTGEEAYSSRLEERIQAVGQQYERFLAGTSSATSKVNSLQKMVDEARAELQFLPELVDKLTTCKTEIDSMVELLTPWSAYADAEDASVTQHLSRYTMEQERDVHTQALQQAGQQLAASNAGEQHNGIREPEQTDAGDDFGDNVELF